MHSRQAQGSGGAKTQGLTNETHSHQTNQPHLAAQSWQLQEVGSKFNYSFNMAAIFIRLSSWPMPSIWPPTEPTMTYSHIGLWPIGHQAVILTDAVNTAANWTNDDIFTYWPVTHWSSGCHLDQCCQYGRQINQQWRILAFIACNSQARKNCQRLDKLWNTRAVFNAQESPESSLVNVIPHRTHTFFSRSLSTMYFSKKMIAKRANYRRGRWASASARPLAQPVLLFSSSHGECHVRHRPAFPKLQDFISFSKAGRTATDGLVMIDSGKVRVPRGVNHVVILLGGNDLSCRRGDPMPPPQTCAETAKTLMKMYQKLKTMAVRVTVCTILPRPRDRGFGYVEECNEALWRLACTNGFRDDVLVLKGFTDADFHDGVHLKATGYTKLVSQLRAWWR